MRRLAQTLGVEAMSLYNHVANKADLLEGVVDLIVGDFELPDPADDWAAAVRTAAISAHDVLIAHPWAAPLVLAPPNGMPSPDAARLRYMEWLLGALRSGGLPPRLVYSGYHALDSHILGFTLWQLGHQVPAAQQDVAGLAAAFAAQLPDGEFANLLEHIDAHLAAEPGDGRREFEFGLDLILTGLVRMSA